MKATAAIHYDRSGSPIGAEETKERRSLSFCVCVFCAAEMFWTYFPLTHLMVGGGSPTALHGTTMSFIQGVVTVPLKVRILAGAGSSKTQQTTFKSKYNQKKPIYRCERETRSFYEKLGVIFFNVQTLNLRQKLVYL